MEPEESTDKASSQDVKSKIAFFASVDKSQQTKQARSGDRTRRGPRSPISATSKSVPTLSKETIHERSSSEPSTCVRDKVIAGKRSEKTFSKELNAKIEEVSFRKSSDWSPNELEVFKKPLCIISAGVKNMLKIEEDTLEQISKIDWPMVVVSVAGLYRTGKSYLMNRLADSSQGFALGDTIESKTKGIWVWCKIHPKRTNTVLLLLDTEGLGDVDKGDPSHDNRIFTLATLLCNCLVYNMKGAFDQDAVNKLTFITEMARNIRYGGRCEADNTSLKLILPDFVLCVRDFGLKLFKNGKVISEDEYLEECLATKTDKGDAFNKPRECIRTYFPERKCFTLPVPGDGDVIENLETLHFDALSNKFKDATIRFVTHIYGLHPKELLASKPVNGLMFTTLATHYVTALKHGAVPDVDDAFSAVAKIENKRVSEEALDTFKKKMTKIQSDLPIPSQDLENLFTETQTSVLNHLRDNVVHDTVGLCEKDAQMKMDNLSTDLRKENNDKIVELCNDKLNQGRKKTFVKNIEGGVYNIAGGYKKYQSDIAKLNEDYIQSLQEFAKHEVSSTWIEFIDSLKVKGEEILKYDDDMTAKEKEEEKRKNEEKIKAMETEHEQDRKSALADQKAKLEQHYEDIEKARIENQEKEMERRIELVTTRLEKEQAEKELQRYKDKEAEDEKKLKALQEKENERKNRGFLSRLGAVFTNS